MSRKKLNPKAGRKLPKLARADLRFSRYDVNDVNRFAVWITSTRAVICDRSLGLEPDCSVLWIENGWGIHEGVVVNMVRPNKAKGVSIRMLDDWSGEKVLRIARSDVVRVIGRYEAVHDLGRLPDGRGVESAPCLARPMLYGGPLATGKPIPAIAATCKQH